MGEQFAVLWDDLIMRSTTKCFGYQHGEALDSFTQTRIRCARDMGGLGLRSLNDHRYSDFIASLCDAIRNINVRLPSLKEDIANWMKPVQEIFDYAESNQQTIVRAGRNFPISPFQMDVATRVKLVADNAIEAHVISTKLSPDQVAKGITYGHFFFECGKRFQATSVLLKRQIMDIRLRYSKTLGFQQHSESDCSCFPLKRRRT